MALIDTVLKIFTKTSKDPNASQPAVGSRSEREAKIKDKAGLVINIFALLLAVNAWYGGKLSSIVLNNTIASSNQWAWYQAKNVRESIYETAAIQSIDKENKEKLIAEAKRMEKDKKEIAEIAKKLEADRDDAKKRSPWISYASTAYQLSIVLLSASILAVSMPLFYASYIVALIGVILSCQGLWLII